MMGRYYDRVWKEKLSLQHYSDLSLRWRSRWEFALQRIPEGSQVLDAGCGDGVLGEMLIQQKGCRVVGLDISAYALQQAAQRGVEGLLCDISQQDFPFGAGQFDAVTLLCCLEHIFDPGHALREATRVLRPEGTVLVSLPNAVQMRFRRDFLAGRLSRDLLHTNDGEGLHIRFFNYRNDFEELLKREAPQLKVVEKTPALKNPRAYSPFSRSIRQIALGRWPNLFAQYSNFVLGKESGIRSQESGRREQ